MHIFWLEGKSKRGVDISMLPLLWGLISLSYHYHIAICIITLALSYRYLYHTDATMITISVCSLQNCYAKSDLIFSNVTMVRRLLRVRVNKHCMANCRTLVESSQ